MLTRLFCDGDDQWKAVTEIVLCNIKSYVPPPPLSNVAVGLVGLEGLELPLTVTIRVGLVLWLVPGLALTKSKINSGELTDKYRGTLPVSRMHRRSLF